MAWTSWKRRWKSANCACSSNSPPRSSRIPARDNLGIEPLPDIDFNIRAGNTLVGYATKEEVQRCMKEIGGGQMRLMGRR